MDNTLAYIDQGSFLGFRGLGRGPLAQFTWVYEHPLDLEGLRRFHRNLAYGLLGRRIESSPLPFGRHRWVAYAGSADIEMAATSRPRSEVPTWADEQLRYAIDPEFGPAWRLAVQPLTEGGAVVTLVASHTLCDGLGMSLAIAEAAKGVRRDLGYPPPGSRSLAQALVEDTRVAVRAVPETARAAVAALRLARKNRGDLESSAGRAAPPSTLRGAEPVTVPSVAVLLDAQQWDERAESLGGTSNSLLAGFAARLAQLQGRTGPDGRVKLSLPVSERTDGDTRGNALTGVMLSVDPTNASLDLRDIRAEIKENLASLSEARNELFAPLPLTPLIPKWLVSRLEGMALGSGSPVGISNLGKLDPAVNRPDGTDAEFLAIRQIESRTTADTLDRLGGTLFVASARVHGKVFITVSAWQVGAVNSRDRLAALVQGTLEEFGLSGTIE